MTPATYTISPASNTETVLQPRQMVRFFNTTASVAFVWLGDAGTSPGSVDITNALAIAPNSAMTVATAELLDGNAIAFKTSAATVQAATLE
jgi:hypothetical protein